MNDQEFVRGVQGKVIEKIVIGNEDDDLFVDIHFQDTTSCFIHVQPAQISLSSVTVLGWKDGNSRVIRKLL